MPAKNNSMEQRACLLKESVLPKECTTQSIGNKKLLGGIDILSETYRKCSIHPDDIKSLALTCRDLNNYIVNSEKEKIIRGKVTHNTAAAIAACKELKAYSIGLSDVKLFGLIKDPSSRRGNLQVNGENISSLYQIAGSDHNSRTLEMFTGAGILHKDILIEEFDTVNEDVLTKKIINNHIDALDIWEKDESSIMEIERSVHEAFSTLKSDSFITEWLRCGYSTKEEHRNCISILGEYINFQHSDLSGKSLRYIDFDNIDLTGSSFDDCDIYKCNFSDAVLDGVTMNNTSIEDCNGYRDADGFVARQLIELGVEGINLSDYSSDED
ncbi:hypothetical protein DSJ_23160 (plasmid) [Pantoea stewartii subsp. stewartii DC283]|nr:hypothetical protein DSJ_23160 [Pantoea stewartii subsp. stewartii DC283]